MKKYRTTTCDQCEGTGTTKIYQKDHYEERYCPKCDGWGYTEK